MFGAGAVGGQAAASAYQQPQQYGGGQSSASGFGAAPASSGPGQSYGSQAGYAAPPAQSGYPATQASGLGQHQLYGASPAYGAAQPGGYPGQRGGPPGYAPGYPGATPAKKSRTGLFVTLAVVAVVVIALAVLLRLLLNKTVLDQSAVQRDVAAQFEDQEGVAVELTCPADMEVTVSATYECTGTTADSEDITLTIEITDENGNYTWQEKPS